MLASQKVAPSSPISSGSSDNPENILQRSFKLKAIGSGGARNTLVENDSLSSYSWPEDTPRCLNRTRRISSVKESGGALGEGVNPKTGLENEQNNSARKASREEQGHVAIDLNPSIQRSGPIHGPSYVEAYMKLMYWTCVSPFNPTNKSVNGPDKSRCDLMLNVAHKTLWGIIATLSLTQSVFEIKQNLLDNLSYPDLETFTDMCFFIMSGATKLYYMYFFLGHQKRLSKMLSSIDKLRTSQQQSTPTNKKVSSSMKYSLILITSSYVVTFIHMVWARGIIDWTPTNAILHHSKTLGSLLLVWNKDDYLNQTLRDAVKEKYGGELTKTNFLLGILRMMIFFSSNIQMDAITNVMLTNAETVKEEMKKLELKIKDPKNDIENITLEQFLAEDGQWAHYKLLKLTVKDNNDAMDVLMRYKHINNLMLFVYIAMNAFDGQASLVYFIRQIYDVIVSSYTYRIASQASNLNETGKKWFVRLAWKSTDKSFQEKLPLILYELEKEPVGLGKGQFMIDESFIFRFLGSVGSVFVLQAQTREPDVDCERV